MTVPFAKYEDGKVWWKGTRDAFVYLPVDVAEALRDEFTMWNIRFSQGGVDGDWAMRNRAFATDLANAIKAYEEADVQS